MVIRDTLLLLPMKLIILRPLLITDLHHLITDLHHLTDLKDIILLLRIMEDHLNPPHLTMALLLPVIDLHIMIITDPRLLLLMDMDTRHRCMNTDLSIINVIEVS